MTDADRLLEAAVSSGFWQAIKLVLDLKISRQAKAAIVDATSALSMETEISRERHRLLLSMLRGDCTSEQRARLAKIEALLLSIPRVTERPEDREAMELIRRAAKELPAGGAFAGDGR